MKHKDQLFPLDLAQPSLFDFSTANSGVVELFPAVWGALEDLVAPQPAVRMAALEHLVALDAPRLSPLVSYMLATRITDPDINVRIGVIRALGNVLAPDAMGRAAPQNVYDHISAFLVQMRTRPIFALLEAADAEPEVIEQVARLINACPFAGNHLSDILAERKAPLVIRKQAANFIGLVGFLDTIPVLERLEVRLSARIRGQQGMPFAPPKLIDETDLLPAIQNALHQLREA